MHRYLGVILLAVSGLQGQMPRPTTLLVEVENWVEYLGESDEVMKHGTIAGVTTPRTPNALFAANLMGDIVSVNGQPAKGFVIHNARAIGATTTMTPGRPIADVVRGSNRQQYFEILKADGT
ncbi:hypothetical protein WDZ92_45445, partial [Nostoc sp. NIES-2111]